MPKKKRAAKPEQERRVYSSLIRVRSTAGDKRTIYGYAAKFAPVQSSDLGGFVEEIHPNAFDEQLRAVPDVRALWNHDANQVPLGRTKSGTLRLSTDKTGLLYEIDPPDTQVARDLMESMARGDVDQSSFGFYCIEESWREGPSGTYIRTVLKAELFDVSPVTFPAYPDATSGVRASLRNAPAALRSKVKRDDLDDDTVCDPDSPDYDPDADCDEDRDSDCACDCAECSSDAEDGCTRCMRSDCDLRVCARGGCPAAGEAENLRLRLRIHQHRAKSSTTR
jgi:HK97 family phage prohead protease